MGWGGWVYDGKWRVWMDFMEWGNELVKLKADTILLPFSHLCFLIGLVSLEVIQELLQILTKVPKIW